MPELVIFVPDDDTQSHQVREAWLDLGVPDLTLLNGTGWAPPACRPDLPLFPSLRSLLHGRGRLRQILFAVVPDGYDVAALAAATEAVTGARHEPGQGLLFVVPVRQV